MGAQGAVFNLLLKDNRFDKFLTASSLLHARLKTLNPAANAHIHSYIAHSHNLHLYSEYKPFVAIASEYSMVRATGDCNSCLTNTKSGATFTFNIFGQFTSDMCVHARICPVGSTAPNAPLLRFCPYPGIRLFDRVELKSDQTVIDDYTPDDILLWSKNFISKDNLTAWERCNGQQDTKEATFYNDNGYTGVMLYQDGLQTPKTYHSEYDMFIPLHFDMCREPSAALPNHIISNTQRTLNIDLCKLSDFIQTVDLDGNVLSPTVNKLQIELTLYINGLYIDPTIYDALASRTNFRMMRVHRRQVTVLENKMDEIKMDKLKYPAEYLMFGFRSATNSKSFDTWHLMGKKRVRQQNTKLIAPALIWNNDHNECQLVCKEAQEATTLDAVIDELGVTAHGITLYHYTRMPFYNSYLPFRYFNKTSLVSPGDLSVGIIPFCLFPGNKDASGYYNLSTGRELHIGYKSSYIDPYAQCELVVSMSAINFLIRRGDTMSLMVSL